MPSSRIFKLQDDLIKDYCDAFNTTPDDIPEIQEFLRKNPDMKRVEKEEPANYSAGYQWLKEVGDGKGIIVSIDPANIENCFITFDKDLLQEIQLEEYLDIIGLFKTLQNCLLDGSYAISSLYEQTVINKLKGTTKGMCFLMGSYGVVTLVDFIKIIAFMLNDTTRKKEVKFRLEGIYKTCW